MHRSLYPLIVACAATVLLTPAVASARDATRKEWLAWMQEVMPPTVCSYAHYRECFKITHDQCMDIADKAYATCGKGLSSQMPSKLGMIKGGIWGMKLGKCANAQMEMKLRNKKKSGCKYP